MEVVKPKRFDFVGENYRLTLGSIWIQPLIYLATPEPGQILGQVIEIESATPSYTVSLANGLVLKGLLSADAQAWAIGDWVVVEKNLGTYRIANPGGADLIDMSDVLRVKAQVRTRSNGKLILDFDSANYGNNSLPWIQISPDAETTIKLRCPPMLNIPPEVYQYDLVFYHSNTTPFDPVIRQFGNFEIVDGITRRT